MAREPIPPVPPAPVPMAATPVAQVPLNNSAAMLLAKLCADLGTEDAAGVLSRALGLLDLVMAAKRQGRRLVMSDPRTGDLKDVVF